MTIDTAHTGHHPAETDAEIAARHAVVAAVARAQRDEDVDGFTTPMYVMTKEDGRWLLTANQNTPIVED
ncbi:hypothetical protein AB0H42_12995 [Nocardia sp. NPDC050799]|uniref:hypothetical protein n=1 Tax=Nocardia sp. NPDC050799 TaxID=3154842 RepID=UPI0034002147